MLWIPLEIIKKTLNLTKTTFDLELKRKAEESQRIIEGLLSRKLNGKETKTEYHDGTHDFIRLTRFPIVDITSIKVDLAKEFGAETLLDSADYIYDDDSMETGLVFWRNGVIPHGDNIVQVIYKGGYIPLTDVFDFDTPKLTHHISDDLSSYGQNFSVYVKTRGTFTTDASGQVLSETFASDVGFTYENTKAEFSGGLLFQKTNVLTTDFYANFDTDTDGTYGIGTLPPTAEIGSPVITSGELDLSGASNKYVEYDGDNSSGSQKGAVRFIYTPIASGTVAYNRYLFAMSSGGNNINNLVRIMIIPNQQIIRWDIYNSTGTSLITSQTGNNITLTAGVPIEFELNWDLTAGASRLFANGSLLNTVQTATGTRAAIGASGIIRLGQDYANSPSSGINGYIEDLVLFNDVQHTANYTPGEAIQQTKYLETSITIPNKAYLGGSGSQLESVTSEESGSPRYIIEGKYYNGSAWVSSDGSYAQANSIADLNTNVSTLDINGDSGLDMEVVFAASNTQSSVDTLTATHAEIVAPFNVVITGIDENGASQTETIEIDSASLIAGDPTFTKSEKSWSEITSVNSVDLGSGGAIKVEADSFPDDLRMAVQLLTMYFFRQDQDQTQGIDNFTAQGFTQSGIKQEYPKEVTDICKRRKAFY